VRQRAFRHAITRELGSVSLESKSRKGATPTVEMTMLKKWASELETSFVSNQK
jgi:hypothetical protein